MKKYENREEQEAEEIIENIINILYKVKESKKYIKLKMIYQFIRSIIGN
ncbi:hypothetical protein [Clostridium butyricum]|nr:hypothetical protein [Clostridium butyricum]